MVYADDCSVRDHKRRYAVAKVLARLAPPLQIEVDAAVSHTAPLPAANHHVVPRFLLRNWSEDGRNVYAIWETRSQKVRQVGIGHATAAPNLNRLSVFSRSDPDRVEQFFASIEGRAARVLRRFYASWTRISHEDEAALCLLLSLQMIRSGEGRELLYRRIEASIDDRAAYDGLVREKINEARANGNLTWATSVEFINLMTRAAERKHLLADLLLLDSVEVLIRRSASFAGGHWCINTVNPPLLFSDHLVVQIPTNHSLYVMPIGRDRLLAWCDDRGLYSVWPEGAFGYTTGVNERIARHAAWWVGGSWGDQEFLAAMVRQVRADL